MLARVSIQADDFNVADEIASLRARDKRVGAVCSFIGTVRGQDMAPELAAHAAALPPEGASPPRGGPSADEGNYGPPVLSMELEHYPGMTEKAIEAMVDEAHRRFNIYAARVVHRIGLLQPGEQIVLVAVTSAHRGQSFQACEFLMDYLKTQAPFWKKEKTPQGEQWVDARVADDAALKRWGIEADNA